MRRTRDRAEWVAMADKYRVRRGNRRCSEVTAQGSVTVWVCARRRPAAQIQGLFRSSEREHRCFDRPTEGARQDLTDGYSEFADGCADHARFTSPLVGEVTLF